MRQAVHLPRISRVAEEPALWKFTQPQDVTAQLDSFIVHKEVHRTCFMKYHIGPNIN